ncbi:MAG: PTPA-CTERM sorting domain-containing protein [Nodosilinea sp.]
MNFKSIFLGFGAGAALVLGSGFSESAHAFGVFDDNPFDANSIDATTFSKAARTTLVEETFGDASSAFRKTLLVSPEDIKAPQTLTFRINNGLSTAIAGYKFSFFNGAGDPVSSLSRITALGGGPFSSTSTTNNAVKFVLANAVDPGSTFDVSFNVNTAGMSSYQTLGILQEAEAVPTPALLPGLVGLGVAALRRKKGSEEEA